MIANPPNRLGAAELRRFPAGAVAITSLAYEDELVAVKHLVAALRGPDAHIVDMLGIGFYVARLEALLPQFEAALKQAKPEDLAFGELPSRAQRRSAHAVGGAGPSGGADPPWGQIYGLGTGPAGELWGMPCGCLPRWGAAALRGCMKVVGSGASEKRSQNGYFRRVWADLGRPVRLGLLVVLLTGCAYREAMVRGHEAEAEQAWEEAVDAYETALRAEPGDERASSALQAARGAWHTEALQTFEQALATGDLAAAGVAQRKAAAARPDDPATASARQRLVEAEAARTAAGWQRDAEKASQNGDLRGAFRLASHAEQVHSTAAGQGLLNATRTRLIEAATQAEAAGRPRAALEDWDELARIEPAQAGGLAAFRGRWAERERALAAAETAPGAAFLHAALAADLSGLAADAARRDGLRQAVLAKTALVLEAAFTGDPEREAALRAALPVAEVPASGPRLRVQVVAAAPACSQFQQTQVAEGRYVSGTREVPNPEWQRGREAVRQQRTELQDAEDAEQRTRRELRDLEERQQRAGRALRERMQRDREEANRRLDRARDDERRALDALRQAQDRRDEADTRRCQSDVDRSRQEVDRAWQASETLLAQVRDERWHGERDTLRDRLTRAEEEVRQRRDRLASAERSLDGLAPTLDEPRFAQHRYPVEHWTRQCSLAAQVEVAAGDRPAERAALVASTQTRDTRHEAQVVLGLDEDLLRFPEDDLGLVARADAELASQLGRLVRQHQKAWAQGLGAQALAQSGTPEGLRLAVAALLLDHESPHPALEQMVRAACDLADLGVLWQP